MGRAEQTIRAQIEHEGSQIYLLTTYLHEMSPDTLGDAISDIRNRCIELVTLRMELQNLEDTDKPHKLRNAGL